MQKSVINCIFNKPEYVMRLSLTLIACLEPLLFMMYADFSLIVLYILELISNFTNIIMIAVCCYGARFQKISYNMLLTMKPHNCF